MDAYAKTAARGRNRRRRARGSVASIPPARRVVGGWLSAGRIDVSVDPNVTIDPGLPAFIDSASPIDPSDAPRSSGSGRPTLRRQRLRADRMVDGAGGRRVTHVERERDLAVDGADRAALEGHIDKLVDARDTGNATWIRDLGNGGIAIDAPHVMLTPQRRLAADSVVAWDDDGITFRLESTIDIDELVLAARSIAAIP